MTDLKSTKTIPHDTKEKKSDLPPRKSFSQRSVGTLALDDNALDLQNRAYRWALLKDKYGRDDYGQCYEMGYRDTMQSSLKGRVNSSSEEKVIRESKDGTYILMDAPLSYREMTNNEMVESNENMIRTQMGIKDRKDLQIDGRTIHINN